MAKHKPGEEKPLRSVREIYEAGTALINEARSKIPVPFSVYSIYDGYNVAKYATALKEACWAGLDESAVIDHRPFAEAWLKLLNHALESAMWCFIYNSNRLVLEEKKAAGFAEEALREYRKVVLAYEAG